MAAGIARARTMAALFGPDGSVPRRIAGYAVLDVLGRGAMGVVYLALDERLDRKVALKLLDPGRRHDPSASASLVTEAKQIARVQHPNVVAVYEVGSHQGDAFLAMEYVAGPTLREWTLGANHGFDAILRVFVDAARGLAAVHDAGLLHRDFKPSNVLVTASGIAKVADFGLARRDDASSEPSEPQGAGDAEATSGSSIIAGTPAYMAPEQMRGQTTARSDQFAFGIALLEALCRRHPFGRDPAYTLDATTASTRVDALDRTRLPGWLFAILRRAIAWDPDARWPDMASLVAALEQNPNRRRRRVLAGLGVATLLGLAAAGWYGWSRTLAARCSGAREHVADAWGDARREQMRAAFLGTEALYAKAAFEHVEVALDEYANEWVRSHTDACEATTVRGEQSPEVMDLRMACLQRAKTGLHAVTAVLADADADADLVSRAHEVVGGLRPLSRCSDVTALRADVEPPRPEHVDAIERFHRHLAEAAAGAEAGRLDRAERSLKAAREALATTDYGPAHAELEVTQGILHEHNGRYEASEKALREALEHASRWRQWEELETAASQLVFVVGNRLQRPEEALRYRELALGLATGDPRRIATLDVHLGMVFLAQGRYEEAEASNRRALAAYQEVHGVEHPNIASTRNNLAAALWQRGKHDEAETEVRRAIEIRVHTLGIDHPETIRSRSNLALMLMVQGDYDAAEAESRVVLEYWQRMYGPSHPEVATAHNNLGLVLHRRGVLAEAEAEVREGLAIRERLLGAAHPSVAESRANLADVLVDRRAHEEAIEQAEGAIDIWVRTVGAEHPHVAAARQSMARALVGLGDLEGALVQHRAALEVRERTLGEEHLDVAQSRSDLAAVLLLTGGEAEARALAERAWDRAQADDASPTQRAEAAFVLARALWTDPAARDRALDLAHRALEVQPTPALRAWLAEHEP